MRIGPPTRAVEARLFDADGATAGVITVGGVGGGFDSPALELYDRLGRELPSAHLGIALLRVKFRAPGELEESVEDVLSGIDFLVARGIRRIGLVGHSFGGAVVVNAAQRRDEVVTVVTLATQSYGIRRMDSLSPRSILLIHGDQDEILTHQCSVMIHAAAIGRKQLHVISGATHCLEEAAPEVLTRVRAWLVKELSPAG